MSTGELARQEGIPSEKELRAARDNLEEQAATRTNDLEEKRSELLQSQQALMNIVEDLNEKTMELEEANSKLRDLDRLKSMFIASMSHELRTPLNSIIGFSSILRDEWLGPVNPEQKENLTTILRSGKHLLTLINDVIDVSKIEAGKIETHAEEFDLYELMTEALQYLEKDMREKGLELHLALQHQTICNDRRRLLQCVINLLSNALKFTERGEIRVATSSEAAATNDSTRPGEKQIRIAVHDTGIGISAEDITRLFQPFVRLESPIKTTVPGTGLGLYLTRKLVGEVLRGDILCTSQVDRGSTFTIRIPERINEKSTGNRG
jgi:signal transduction histidine kinase